jgi:hypothetical protein
MMSQCCKHDQNKRKLIGGTLKECSKNQEN